MDLEARKPVFGALRPTKAHANLYIRDFDIRFLENITANLATSEKSLCEKSLS